MVLVLVNLIVSMWQFVVEAAEDRHKYIRVSGTESHHKLFMRPIVVGKTHFDMLMTVRCICMSDPSLTVYYQKIHSNLVLSSALRDPNQVKTDLIKRLHLYCCSVSTVWPWISGGCFILKSITFSLVLINVTFKNEPVKWSFSSLWCRDTITITESTESSTNTIYAFQALVCIGFFFFFFLRKTVSDKKRVIHRQIRGLSVEKPTSQHTKPWWTRCVVISLLRHMNLHDENFWTWLKVKGVAIKQWTHFHMWPET